MLRCSNILKCTSINRVIHMIGINVSKPSSFVRRRLSLRAIPRYKLSTMATYCSGSTQAGSNCCDNFFSAEQIEGLPRRMTTDDGQVLEINYARQAEVTSSLRTMLQSSGERGDNIGTDEFQGPYGEYLTESAFIFTARLATL